MEKSRTLTDFTLIVFGEDFGRHPHALEHLLTPFFGKATIYWVETVGLRSPRLSLYDFRRVVEKVKRFLFGYPKAESAAKAVKDFTILVPFMIPYNQFKIVRMLNRLSVQSNVRRALAKNTSAVISIASVPQAGEYVGAFGEKRVVYFCVDDFEEWPGLDKSLVADFERKLVERADLIFGTSKKLCLTRTKPEQVTTLISHGVDLRHFLAMPKQPIAGIGPIRLCYFGLFDERSDQALLAQVVLACSAVELHIIGPVACEICEDLKTSSRVVFHGKVPYSDLPSKIQDMHVLVLPYVRNELTASLSPLKLKEYLATEKPVISTRLIEVEPYEAYTFLANTAEEWIAALTFIQKNSFATRNLAVRKYLEENETWFQKAQIFEQKITASLDGNR